MIIYSFRHSYFNKIISFDSDHRLPEKLTEHETKVY